MKVVVTGASGFIGSNLCIDLVKEGYIVHGIYRNVHNFDKKKLQGVYSHCLDINDYDRLHNLIKTVKPDGIFHTAALHPAQALESPHKLFEDNVKSTLNLLEVSRNLRLKRFIYSSSMSLYGKAKYLPVDEKHPLNPYDFYSYTKYLAEDLCKFYAQKFHLKITILRYVGVYGPGRKWGALVNFCQNALKNLPLTIENNINWDILYVRDVTYANIKAFKVAFKQGFEIINIGSGKEVNIIKLAKLIKKISKSKSKIIKSPTYNPRNSFHFYFDITKAKKILNFHPHPLKEGLADYLKDCTNDYSYTST